MNDKTVLKTYISELSNKNARRSFWHKALTAIVFLAATIASSRVKAQTLYPSSASSSTPGLLQLQTTDPGLAGRASYFSSDLVGQPAGEYLVQAFDAPASVLGTIQAADVRLYMAQPAGDLGAIFPKVKLLLNGPSGPPVCTMSSSTALGQTIQPINFIRMFCNGSINVPVAPTDRYYLWVGFDLASTPTVSTQVQIAVGNVARGFGSPAVDIGVLLTPSISSISPTSGAIGSVVTISGSNFGSSAGSVSLNGTQATIQNWTDSQVQILVPPGATSGNISVTANGQTSNGVGFTVVNPLAVGAGMQLSITDTPLQVNLTSPQILDWIHWGRISATVPDRKNGTPLISDFTAVNGAQASPSFGNIAFSWSDGNHPASVSQSIEDIETFNTASGFQVTVPADTTVKTLNLYAEIFAGQGVLHASLSDGSSADISDQTVIDSDTGNKVYSIDFRAASAGQTLTVTFTGTASTNGVGLQAATLSAHLPTVSITAPTTGQSFTGPATVAANANAGQFDNQLTDVKITGSDGTILDGTTSPLVANLGPLNGGHYSLTASATDSAGLTNGSSPVEFDVIGQGGSIAVQKNDVTATSFSSPIDLDAQGTADWILWGPFDNGDEVINNPDFLLSRKTGVTPLISNFRPIGNHPIQGFVFANSLFFTGNSQLFFGGSNVLIHGTANGYEITVPADTTSRTLQLYAGTVSARGRITAFLSDGSAPVATDISFDNPAPVDSNGFGAVAVYAITHQAASAGQTLTVRYTLDFDYGHGEVDLIGATLNGTLVVPAVPAPQITSISPETAPTNTKVTIAGSNFGATQGTSSVYFANTPVQILNWSDTSIDVVVPATLTDGGATQVVVNTASGTSNNVTFRVPLFQLFPSSLSILVGGSGTVIPKDSSHNLVSGLNWFTTDPSIVSVSTDDPALIIGLAPGTATVYAGDVSFQVTVYAGTSLPTGTPFWSMPPSPGASGFSSLVPAVPSGSDADLFAYDDAGFLSAFSSDGELLWRQYVPNTDKVIPDFAGNVLVKWLETIISPVDGTWHQHHKISKVDPNTGTLTDFYTFADHFTSACAVFPPGGGSYESQCFDDNSTFESAVPDTTGVLFVQENSNVTVVDMTTNQVRGSAQVNQGNPSTYGQIIVAGDGNAYVPFAVIDGTVTHPDNKTEAVHEVNTISLLGISPDGTSATTTLDSWTYDTTTTTLDILPGIDQQHTFAASHTTSSGSPPPNLRTNAAITNADTGVAVFAGAGNDGICSDAIIGSYRVDGDPNLHTYFQGTGCGYTPSRTWMGLASKGSSGSHMDAQINDFIPGLQREDGSFIGIDNNNNNNVAAVALDGTVQWKTALTVEDPGVPVIPLYATADGGVIITSTFKDVFSTIHQGSLFTLDQNGNLITQAADNGAIYSWKGNWYTASSTQTVSYDIGGPYSWTQDVFSTDSQMLSEDFRGIYTWMPAPPVGTAGVAMVYQPPMELSSSNGAVNGGTPSQIHTYELLRKLKLIWQASTEETSGGVVFIMQPVQFIFYKVYPSADDPLVITQLTDTQKQLVKDRALAAFKRDYRTFGVYVCEAGRDCNEDAHPKKGTKYIRVIGNDLTGDCGITPIPGGDSSMIIYRQNLQQMQLALKDGVLDNKLLGNLGEGIGNNAAHESAHALGVPIPPMDTETLGFIDTGNCLDPAIFDGTIGPFLTADHIWWSTPVLEKLNEILNGK